MFIFVVSSENSIYFVSISSTILIREEYSIIVLVRHDHWIFSSFSSFFDLFKYFSSALFIYKKLFFISFRQILKITISITSENIDSQYRQYIAVISSSSSYYSFNLMSFSRESFYYSFEVDSFKYRSLDDFKLYISSLFRFNDISSIISYSI